MEDREIRKGGLVPLELLPEGIWLLGTIENVEARQRIYNNQPCFVTNPETKEQILDSNGEFIPIYEWNFTIRLKDYTLPNGKPRHIWMSLRESLSPKAKLPDVFLNLTGKNLIDIPKVAEAIAMLKGLNIKFQVINAKGKKDPKKIYQKIIEAMVRLA